MADRNKLALCRAKLIDVARSRGKITYGELAEHIGSAARSMAVYLNPIWEAERAAGRPDLTVIVVNNDAKYGKRLPGSPEDVMDQKNPEHVRVYEEELKRVYEYDWPDV